MSAGRLHEALSDLGREELLVALENEIEASRWRAAQQTQIIARLTAENAELRRRAELAEARRLPLVDPMAAGVHLVVASTH